ncbi:MAG TPA: type II toxin-antitoxin system VapC family toxin [Stellaceae bacterium]|jgi:PIN domain nuclease of toxin-antitoxin system|nr:type II toxin-antitoxin system VapC family toxin [Stellaceae bacterium]
MALKTSLLADTHYVIWLRAEPQRLTGGERRVLDETDNRYVSIVTLWEIAILIGRGRVPGSAEWLETPKGFELLPIQVRHCRALLDLPPLHGDPFDRMLVAQARSEQIPLMTRDRRMSAYEPFAPIIHGPV